MTISPNAIFSANTNEQIGYVEGSSAYDLKHQKRYDVDAAKNLIDPATKKVVGHLQDGGGFTGAGTTPDSLFE